MTYTVHMPNNGKSYSVKLGGIIIEEGLKSRDSVISFIRRDQELRKRRQARQLRTGNC